MIDSVERPEDMGNDGKLELIRQPDGDIIVVVRKRGPDDRLWRSMAVEFCLSGSRSRHTHRALRHLFTAMEQDNVDRPICESQQENT